MIPELPKKTILQKFYLSIYGALLPFKTEVSIRIQLLCVVAGIVLGIYLNISRNDWLWIAGASAILLITETLNTSIEKLVDLVSPGYNEIAGKVKDLAAGAVFMAGATAFIIALLVFSAYW